MANDKKGGLLHEVLAVVGSLQGAKDKIAAETVVTFTKKPTHFTGHHRELRMLDEARKSEGGVDQHVEMVTTVMEKLNYMTGAFIKFWDAKFQKELGAQEAKADIEVDGVVLVQGVPVYFLLEMEKELGALRSIYESIPTLAPGAKWDRAPDRGDGVWESMHVVEDDKTEKVFKSNVIVPATDHHPAQIREWTENVVVGKYALDRWSGCLSPAEKSVIIGRVDKLRRAVKRARQRANTQEVPKAKMGKALFEYIHTT